MKLEKVVFMSGTLKLEGRLMSPAAAGTDPVPGVVLCHPHPLYGGSMNNNVTHALSKALVEKGIAALLFNFRGVGLSEGAYDHGRGEMEDARSAVLFLAAREGIDSFRLGLIGYSFGGTVALASGIGDDDVKAVAAVSPPELPDLSGPKPRLIVCGTKDTLVSASGIQQEIERIAGDGAASVEIIEGADHFWGGYEGELADLVVDFFTRIFFV